MVEHDYIEESPTARLRNWVLAEMLRGAGYAAALLFLIGIGYGVIWGIGQLLPAESKNAPPPMPFSALEAPLHVAKA
ncbi:MAG: RC-LH1 core complex protein PufX [Roseinatronobacter sp.]